MNQPHSFTNLWRLLLLVVVAAFLIYVNQVVEPLSPSLFLPSPTPTTLPESFITNAESLVTQGKYSQAIAEYQKAIQSDPKDPANYISMASLYIYNGNYSQAVTAASNALLLKNNSSQAEALKGFAQGLNGDYLDGTGSLDRAVQLDPSNPYAYAYQGILYAQQIIDGQNVSGNLEKAIEASRKAVLIAPNALETHWARGVVLEVTANYTDAITEFQAAVAQNANIAALHMALGRNYKALQKFDTAVEEFTKASALNPTDPNPVLNISRVYAGIGEYAKAIQYAEQAVANSPTDPFMYGNLGSLYFKNRMYPEAFFALKLSVRGGTTPEGVAVQGLSLGPGRIGEYYYDYGMTLMRLGYCGEAVQIAQAVQQALSDDEIAVYNSQYTIDNCQSVLKSNLPTPTFLPSPTARPTGTPTPALTPTSSGG